MTYSAFRTLLSSFVNRKDVTSSQLDYFVNVALADLQAAQPFNFTRKKSSLTYPATTGVGVALPSEYRSMSGNWPVRFSSTEGTLVPLRGSTFDNESRRTVAHLPYLSDWSVQDEEWDPGIGRPVFYVTMEDEAPTLWLNPEPAAELTLVAWHLCWIADYGTDLAREDFLLLHGHQVLLWDALKMSNSFVSEEYKVAVNKELRDEAFANLIMFDARIPTDGDVSDLR